MSWLLLSLLLLCLSACSSSDDALTTSPTEPNQPGTLPNNGPKLYLYVYAPQQAEPTRTTYEGDVSAVNQEATIFSMQIWVFTHNTNKLIGYYSPTTPPGLTSSHPYEEFQLTIDETYAKTEANNRENVDVYVLANVTPETCNVTLNETTTQAQLEDAVMSKTTLDPFGITTPVTSVPENVGLPMSGVLRDQPVTGTSPVLRLDNGGELAKVMLRRTVSKLRFAFSRETDSETLTINSIQLNTEMIPMSEFLFMTDANPYDRHTCHIKTDDGYNTTTPNLLGETISDVAELDDPAYYAWGTNELDPFHYEWLIDAAASDGYLTQRVFFLRESDKKLLGTIKYQIGEGDEQTATFTMIDEGGFSRNHIWTVYAYQANAKLQVVVATVTPWRQIEEEYDFNNW